MKKRTRPLLIATTVSTITGVAMSSSCGNGGDGLTTVLRNGGSNQSTVGTPPGFLNTEISDTKRPDKKILTIGVSPGYGITGIAIKGPENQAPSRIEPMTIIKDAKGSKYQFEIEAHKDGFQSSEEVRKDLFITIKENGLCSTIPFTTSFKYDAQGKPVNSSISGPVSFDLSKSNLLCDSPAL